MTNDQRPVKIRAVATTGKEAQDAQAQDADSQAGADAAALDNHAAAPAKSGPSLVAVLLFLTACGAGGALVTALPFLVTR